MIAKVALPLPIEQLFDYLIPERLWDKVKKGMRIKIIFNKRFTIGYVTDICSQSKITKLKSVVDVLDKGPIFTAFTLELAKKIKDYYICSYGEALDIMIPNVLKRSKCIEAEMTFRHSIRQERNGKTIYIQDFSNEATLRYYLEEIIKKIENKKKVILVVPQISSIKQISEYFSKISDLKIGIWHGKLSRIYMQNFWADLASDKIDLIIGTRSCIFAPLNNLGLIIIKDEDDFSHKSDQVPYYHAARIAQMRQELEKCDMILSSCIPSAQTYYQFLRNKGTKTNIEAKINTLAEIEFSRINFRDKIDMVIEKEITTALEKKEKILVFLNKKGFATFIYCRKCKEALKCSRCSSNLRFDYFKKELVCPWCNFRIKLIEICPSCNSSYVKFSGFGIEKLESNLKRFFPLAKIVTLDELVNSDEKSVDYDIVVATKKIINFPNLKFDITIIWNLDALLNIGDFKATEETFQLLSKLLLITSRKMIISSGINSEFYLFKNLKKLNFREFYNTEFKIRKSLSLPPYYRMGLVSIRSLDRKRTETNANRIYYFIKKSGRKVIKMSHPYETLRSKIREKYYKYILLKSKNITLINRILKKILKKHKSSKVIITVDIDPV